MAVVKETVVSRYVGLAGDTKPSACPTGSTYYEYDTGSLYITYDGGAHWVAKASQSAAARALSATIASGASLSGAVDLRGLTVIRLVMPAAWTAASLTFQGSDDGVAYANLYDWVGSEYIVAAAAASRIMVPPADLLGSGYLKIRSGTAGSAVNQAASRVIGIVARPI